MFTKNLYITAKAIYYNLHLLFYKMLFIIFTSDL